MIVKFDGKDDRALVGPAADGGVGEAGLVGEARRLARRQDAELSATIGEREDAKVASADAADASQGKLGVVVRPLTAEEKKETKLDNGLVVEDVAGPAAKAGVAARRRDRLDQSRARGKPGSNSRDSIDKAGKAVALLIQRDDARIFIPVTIG